MSDPKRHSSYPFAWDLKPDLVLDILGPAIRLPDDGGSCDPTELREIDAWQHKVGLAFHRCADKSTLRAKYAEGAAAKMHFVSEVARHDFCRDPGHPFGVQLGMRRSADTVPDYPTIKFRPYILLNGSGHKYTNCVPMAHADLQVWLAPIGDLFVESVEHATSGFDWSPPEICTVRELVGVVEEASLLASVFLNGERQLQSSTTLAVGWPGDRVAFLNSGGFPLRPAPQSMPILGKWRDNGTFLVF